MRSKIEMPVEIYVEHDMHAVYHNIDRFADADDVRASCTKYTRADPLISATNEKTGVNLDYTEELVKSTWLELEEREWLQQGLTEEDTADIRIKGLNVISAIFMMAFSKRCEVDDVPKHKIFDLCRGSQEYGCWLRNISLAVDSVDLMNEVDVPEWVTVRLEIARRGVFTLIWAMYDLERNPVVRP